MLHRLKKELALQGVAQNRRDLLAMRDTLITAKHQGMDNWEFPIVEELFEKYGQLLEKVRA